MEHSGPSGGPPQPEDEYPLRFGPYVVVEQIGSGGMGAVYRARDQRLQRDVAIKVLHRNLAIVGAQERFLREARAVSSLSHPNICTVFDIGEENGDPYMVMELLEGLSLRDRFEVGPSLEEPELRVIAMQAAMALSAAHAKGIVHRDIKPANIFLVSTSTREVLVKVLDFGLAKLESDRQLRGESGLTRTGSTVGTVEYMSPEQARGEDLDPRSDLFSLGAVLYELATGDVPFRGPTSAVVFAALLGEDPTPARACNPMLSPGMDEIIRRLLQKKREHRLQTAQELLAALRALPEGSGRAAQRSALTSAPPIRMTAAAAAGTPADGQTVEGSAGTAAPVAPVKLASAPRHTVPVTDPRARVARPRIESAATAAGTRPAYRSPRPAVDLFGAMADAADESSSSNRRWPWFVAVVVVALLAGGLAMHWKLASTPNENTIDGALQVAAFQNGTGDAAVDGVTAAAMRLLLDEAPGLDVLPEAVVPGGAEKSAKQMAQESGAAEYVGGEVTRDGARYVVHARVVRVRDGETLAEEESSAESLTELPSALSQLAVQLRTHMGETAEQASAHAVPLEREASSSLRALRDYADGVARLRAGASYEAATLFRRALAEDASFPAARIGLAEALRQSGAEQERMAAVAGLREDAVSVCQNFEILYQRAADAGALNAARRWATACPKHALASIAVARQEIAAGRGAEGEAAAMRALALDPGNRAAYSVATEAMLLQNRFEPALQMQQRAAAARQAAPGLMLLAAYLRGDGVVDETVRAAAARSEDWNDAWNYVTYLSNRGQLEEARQAGEAAAERVERLRIGVSAAKLMRTRLALLRAMAGHCDAAIPEGLGSEHGAYMAALADAWCHRAAGGGVPSGAASVSLAEAAQLWADGHAAQALPLLDTVRHDGQTPVAKLLRGEAHLQTREEQFAVGDFSAVLSRRGAAVLTGTLAYPAAQAGLAAAYRAMGDVANADRVQAELRAGWTDALASEPLLQHGVKVVRGRRRR